MYSSPTLNLSCTLIYISSTNEARSRVPVMHIKIYAYNASLGTQAHGEFSITEFVRDSIPQYAKVSHTEGADGKVVTYKDLVADWPLWMWPTRSSENISSSNASTIQWAYYGDISINFVRSLHFLEAFSSTILLLRGANLTYPYYIEDRLIYKILFVAICFKPALSIYRICWFWIERNARCFRVIQ